MMRLVLSPVSRGWFKKVTNDDIIKEYVNKIFDCNKMLKSLQKNPVLIQCGLNSLMHFE